MKNCILLLALLLLPYQTFATHIIGGTIEYSYTGNNTYELHLIVYRDCLNGFTPFDNPAAVAIYNPLGVLALTLNLTPDDSNDVFVQGNCIPGNVCIRKANYYGSVTLPSTGGPYTVVYQRCCRSQSIVNLVSPEDYGMSFYNHIPQVVNNSPVFANEFAAFTYVGDNFIFDASAVDIDGDDLVYSLDDVHDGADLTNPAPNPPSPPPYPAVPWQPPYSQNDMIGGPVPLTIDPYTGLMTAIPGSAGVFSISMKVEEYRYGTLIGTTRREFVLAVNPPDHFDMEGMVSADNGPQLLDYGKSWLIRYNLLDSTLLATDTNAITNGSFSHIQSINGVYLVKASADTNSTFYSSNIPTYYGNELFWYDATDVELCGGNAWGIDIEMVQGINPGGPGFIGGLISQGANRNMSVPGSLEGITVILFNTQNQPVAYDVTDVNGNFEIGNLALGTYNIFVDRLNYLIDNTIAPSITLTAANPSQNNLSFLLHNTWLEHNGTVGLSENPNTGSSFTIFPNPVNEFLYVQSSVESLHGKTYTILNVLGETIAHGILDSGSISVSQIPPQVYLIKIDGDNGSVYTKFVKQ